MRRLLFVLVVVGCGPGARSGSDDGVTVDAASTEPDACDTLECQAATCEARGLPPTTVSGTVFAPNGTLALSGVSVYIPTGTPAPMAEGAQCTRCQDAAPADAIATDTSANDGTFKLSYVPAGRVVQLVTEIGKWRRIVELPPIVPCTDNPLGADLTRLPRSRAEGDLPLIATTTGSNDKFECLIRKLGVADQEFTTETGAGRIHVYAGNGATAFSNGTRMTSAQTLWGNVDNLDNYDLVMFGCEGEERPETKPQEAMNAVKAYADRGGRLFMSHYHKIWITGDSEDATHAPAVWPSVATCNIDGYEQVDAVIDQATNPKGVDFAAWMDAVGGTTNGLVPITDARQSCQSVDLEHAEQWAYARSSFGRIPVNFQFTTPNEAVEDERCGKVVFSDMHVSTGGGSGGFPSTCSTAPLTPQEKALAYLFFNIATCVGAPVE